MVLQSLRAAIPIVVCLSALAQPGAIPNIRRPRVPGRVHLSESISRGRITRFVQASYPAEARMQRVEGDVRLWLVIDKKGEVEEVQVEMGHPLLIPAAVDALRQWRFKPYLLNGKAVEVETYATIRFRLPTALVRAG